MLAALPILIALLTGCGDTHPDVAKLAGRPLITSTDNTSASPPPDARHISQIEFESIKANRAAATRAAVASSIGLWGDRRSEVATPAKSGFELCNSSLETVSTAIGFQSEGGWTSKGWYSIPTGECRTLLTAVTAGSTYYFRATGARGSTWGSGHSLCVRSSAFTIQGARDCPAKGSRSANFTQVRNVDSDSYLKVNLTGGRPSKIHRLDVGDGVYVRGVLSDELAFIARIDVENDQVKVRRSRDGTTVWVRADDIITREESQMNDAGRGIIALGVLVCGLSPDSCKKQ